MPLTGRLRALVLVAVGTLTVNFGFAWNLDADVPEQVVAYDPYPPKNLRPRGGYSQAATWFTPGVLLPEQYVCGPIRSPLDLDGKVVLFTSLERACQMTAEQSAQQLKEILDPLRSHPNFSRLAFILDYNCNHYWGNYGGVAQARETIAKVGLKEDCTVYINLRGGTTSPWENVSIQDHLGRVVYGDGHSNFQIGGKRQRQKVTEVLRSLLDALPGNVAPDSLLSELPKGDCAFLASEMVAGKNVERVFAFLRRESVDNLLLEAMEAQVEVWRERQIMRLKADYGAGCYWAARLRYERLKATLPSSSEKGIEGIERLFGSPFWRRMEALERQAGRLLSLSREEAIALRDEMRRMGIWDVLLWEARKKRKGNGIALPLCDVPDVMETDSPEQMVGKLGCVPDYWDSPLDATIDFYVADILHEARIEKEMLGEAPSDGSVVFECEIGRPLPKVVAEYGEEAVAQKLEKHCRLLMEAFAFYRKASVPFEVKLAVDSEWRSAWETRYAPILAVPEMKASIVWKSLEKSTYGLQPEPLFPTIMRIGKHITRDLTYSLWQPYNGKSAGPFAFYAYERAVRQSKELSELRLTWPNASEDVTPPKQNAFPLPSFAPKRVERWKVGNDLEAEAKALRAYGEQHPAQRLEARYCAWALDAHGKDMDRTFARLLADDPLTAIYRYPLLVKTWPTIFVDYKQKIEALRRLPSLAKLANVRKVIANLSVRMASNNTSVRVDAHAKGVRLLKQCETALQREENPSARASLERLIERLRARLASYDEEKSRQ